METLLHILPALQIALAILLVGAILLQQRGAGLGGAFGAQEGSVHYERRGFERTIFKGTFIIAILFVLSVMIPLIVGNENRSMETETIPAQNIQIETENSDILDDEDLDITLPTSQTTSSDTEDTGGESTE